MSKKEKATETVEKKKLNPRQVAVNALASLMLDCDHKQFNARYSELVEDLRAAVQAKWAPARVKAKVLRPMQEALGSKGMTPETILEAIYTNADAMGILMNLREDYLEQEKKAQAAEVDPAPAAAPAVESPIEVYISRAAGSAVTDNVQS